MRTQFLIDAIVRQTTVLIAQLATTGGVRAPLSHIAGQVFLDLAREIESQGVSRKVSADMFGLALRTYQRPTQRLRESATMRGRSLWEAIFDYLSSEGMVSRDEVLRRFRHDDEAGESDHAADTHPDHRRTVLRATTRHPALLAQSHGHRPRQHLAPQRNHPAGQKRLTAPQSRVQDFSSNASAPGSLTRGILCVFRRVRLRTKAAMGGKD